MGKATSSISSPSRGPSLHGCANVPSEAAADVVLYYAEKGRGWPHPELLGRDG